MKDVDGRATDGPRRLPGLDGIRGLAALFVVMHHTFLRSFPGYPRITSPAWAGWLIFGHFAVVVFIVLSGFSLAVSPARHGWALGSPWRFEQRRAWRILPPYWAALVFSLLVAWFLVPQPGLPKPTASSAVAHALLIQDFSDAPTPNRAFWTIAIEVQLYLVFPLLLLMIRRVGSVAMLAAVTVVVVYLGLAAPHVSTVDSLMTHVFPQFAALFATGVVAAGIVSAGPTWRRWPWGLSALLCFLPILALMLWKGSVWTLGQHLFWVDLALGPAIGCLLAAVATGHPAPLVRALDIAPVRRLGSFSYSLYLTHAPIVMVVYTFIVAGHVPQGVPSLLVSLAITLPVTISFAWLFATVFELPFQRHRGWPSFARRRLHLPAVHPANRVTLPPPPTMDVSGHPAAAAEDARVTDRVNLWPASGPPNSPAHNGWPRSSGGCCGLALL